MTNDKRRAAAPFACALALFMGALGAAPSLASAQDADALRLSTFFGLGVGGTGQVETGAFTVESDLDATVGFGLRLEVPVLEYLTLGGQLGFNFMKIDGVDDRDPLLDLPDLIVRGRYPIQLNSGLLEPYVGFLVGGTLHILGEGDNKDTAYGWNVGVLFGAQYFFTDMVGALVEVGWHRHAANHNVAGDADAKFSMNQAALNFGVSFLF
jgi:hypothetical protein